ncbi:MAG TPA: helix-hairpin-helix domain-containing protein [Smithella sp.]|nr:helix-hairpin-helix domain-containing protein [Smithella sp.]
MTISENKLRGLIAVCLILAIIPFIIFGYRTLHKYKIPPLADQCDGCLAIEVFKGDQNTGVYFAPPGTTANGLLKSAGIGGPINTDFPLMTGMKLILNSASGDKDIVVAEMPAADRLSLGLPIDINRATEDDLLLIKGVGQATAQNILDFRKKINRFKDIRQLMEIKGIKEKKLAELQKYLYVEKK